MGVPPSTRASLLVRTRDGRDAEVWSRFVEAEVVAVKVLAPAHASSALARRRFLREARAAAVGRS